ncbi:MAG: UbiD family decarboxylase [Deltaproteobacteria bacterium]|nr:UbiD family decarboxylase [Deltaproteobacteria bacterium]
MDMNRFRLRSFVEKLIELGEVEIHEEPVPLADLSRIIEETPKATLFRKAGPEQVEVVAAVCGSRSRVAAALGVEYRQAPHEYMRRMANPQPVIEVPSKEAPAHEIVLAGEDADLTKLAFHVQHEFDGGTYISSGIDYTVDPETGRTNVGCRRLMLRGRHEMRSNLTNNSDLKKIYLKCLERGQRLNVSFVIGSHPIDFLAAGLRLPADEFALVATLRGEPLSMVRGVTNNVPVPADAEIVIEGYFDELGHRELEGPYGEGYGYYGPMHIDPVFHVTAITRRKDALFQSLLHSGQNLSRADSPNIAALNAEVAAWKALRAAGIEPAVICAPTSTGRQQHVRVAIKQKNPDDARRVISALFAVPRFKHVFVVNEDIDVFSDEQVEWAMATRFRADKDIVIETGFPPHYMDPIIAGDDVMTKVGFDLTVPFGWPDRVENRVAHAPRFEKPARFKAVSEALKSKPMYFAELMEAVGSRDGREIALELDRLREEGMLTRLEDGEWALKLRA